MPVSRFALSLNLTFQVPAVGFPLRAASGDSGLKVPANGATPADTTESLKAFLHANVLREYRDWYGVGDGPWVARAVNNWFDDRANLPLVALLPQANDFVFRQRALHDVILIDRESA